MKIKTKLALACSMFALVIFTVVAGVLAVTTLNFNIGGSINFTAKGINATISAGILSATGSHVTASDADNKMKQIVLSTKTEVPNHSANVASWTGLNLLFNENGDDVTITFTIKNDAETGSTDKVYTKITTTAGTGATNATVSVNTPTTEIEAQATKTFVITFHITEPSLNAELPNFVITVELAQESFDTAPASLTFADYTLSPNTVAVSGFDNSVTSVAIPETITKDGTTYTVTTIKASAFANATGLEEITIPQTTTNIGADAFNGCTKLKTVYLDCGVDQVASSLVSSKLLANTTSVYVPTDVSVPETGFTNVTSDVTGYNKYTQQVGNTHNITFAAVNASQMMPWGFLYKIDDGEWESIPKAPNFASLSLTGVEKISFAVSDSTLEKEVVLGQSQTASETSASLYAEIPNNTPERPIGYPLLIDCPYGYFELSYDNNLDTYYTFYIFSDITFTFNLGV